MTIRMVNMAVRCARVCKRIATSPHKHHIAGHGLEMMGAGLVLIQDGLLAHVLLFGGAGLLMVLALIDEVK